MSQAQARAETSGIFRDLGAYLWAKTRLRFGFMLSPERKKELRRVARLRNPRWKADALARQLYAQRGITFEPRQPTERLVVPRVEAPKGDEGFVAYAPPAAFIPKVKVIAYYLPQFHPFAENDAWWGKGFTEWSNVGKAVPNFAGHYQPHCPIHLGYYDLRLPEVMEEQAKIAREYGISGFSYYFYWFGGKTLMEAPLRAMLENPRVDMPFCFTWANENWTRRWDGKDEEVLIAQNHSPADSLAFLRHLKPYFDDPRYIRVDGRPMLIVYRPGAIPDLGETIAAWRNEAIRMGYPGLYLVGALTFGLRDPVELGFDAGVEFPPHGLSAGKVKTAVQVSNPSYVGNVYDYEQAADSSVTRKDPAFPVIRTAMLSWDNTARRQDNSATYANFSIAAYRNWLAALCHRVLTNPKIPPERRFVFVNAWNEWAEGAHLEPDRKYGFGYLQATADVLASYKATTYLGPEFPTHAKAREAVILHLHYPDLWPEIRDALATLPPHDLYVTATSAALARQVAEERPDAYVEFVENRGRDVRPFLSVLRRIRPLGYRAVLKLHSKRSPHLQRGDEWRRSMMAALVTPKAMQHLAENDRVGVLVPKHFLATLDPNSLYFNRDLLTELTGILGINGSLEGKIFPMGSMFWFRPEALVALDRIDLDLHWGLEKGETDGTMAHAVERVIAILAEKEGLITEEFGEALAVPVAEIFAKKA